MPNKTLNSRRQNRLIDLLVEHRKAASMTQMQLAEALGQSQPWVANLESGQRRVDAVELLDLAEAMGFDVHALIDELLRTPKTA